MWFVLIHCPGSHRLPVSESGSPGRQGACIYTPCYCRALHVALLVGVGGRGTCGIPRFIKSSSLHPRGKTPTPGACPYPEVGDGEGGEALTVPWAGADDPSHTHRTPLHVLVITLSRQEGGEGKRRPKGREGGPLPCCPACCVVSWRRSPSKTAPPQGSSWSTATLRLCVPNDKGLMSNLQQVPSQNTRGFCDGQGSAVGRE